MLKLPHVTLVLIETREHDLALMALEDCERRAEFGDVLVFTDLPTQFIRGDRRVEAVDDWPDKLGWSKQFWSLGPYLRTSHVLGIQWDSWIVDPEMWRDEYLDYDYIGSPWWYEDGMNVGNGGFSLRSTALLRYVHKNRDRFPCVVHSDDDLYCRKYRPALEAAGFQWAPEPLAKDFAFECVPPKGATFGFHATFNFDYGCRDDESRLLQRAELMARSDYVKGKSWDKFLEKCPRAREVLKEETQSG